MNRHSLLLLRKIFLVLIFSVRVSIFSMSKEGCSNVSSLLGMAAESVARQKDLSDSSLAELTNLTVFNQALERLPENESERIRQRAGDLPWLVSILQHYDFKQQENKCFVSGVSGEEKLVLEDVAQAGLQGVLRHMLAHGNFNEEVKMKALTKAVQAGCYDVAVDLVNAGISRYTIGSKYGSRLLFAALEEEHDYFDSIALVEALLLHGASPFRTDDYGKTPLMSACNRAKSEMICESIRKIAENLGGDAEFKLKQQLNMQNNKRFTPLDFAIVGGDNFLVKFLLSMDAKGDEYGLLRVAVNGYCDIAQELINVVYQRAEKAGVQGSLAVKLFVNKGLEKSIVENGGVQHGTTPLSLSLYHGHAALADLFLRSGAELPPLLNIIEKTNKACLEKLFSFLRGEAKLKGKDEHKFLADYINYSVFGATAWDYVDDFDIGELLLKAGARGGVTWSARGDLLFRAAQEGHTGLVGALLETGIYSFLPDWRGESLLSHAREHGQIEVAKQILRSLRRWAKKNGQDPDKEERRYIKSQLAKYSRCAVTFDQASTDADWKDLLLHTKLKRSLRLMLLEAAGLGDQSRVKSLIKIFRRTGMLIDDCYPSDFRTALFLAALNGHLAVARDLLDAGASVFFRDYKGRTPLMYAASNGHYDIVELLLNHVHCRALHCGVDEKKQVKDYVNMKDESGVSALFFARSGKVMAYLLNAGSDQCDEFMELANVNEVLSSFLSIMNWVLATQKEEN